MNTAEQINIDELARKIADNLVKATPPERIMWGAKSCAEYLKISVTHFRSRTCYMPDFPKARKLSNGERPERRWLAVEVMDWFEKRH